MNDRKRGDELRGKLVRNSDKLSPRTVPGFSVQTSQKNTVTAGPGRVPRVTSAASRPTAFAVAYGRHGFPVTTVHGLVDGRRFRWLVPPELVDYSVYLPVMADGLRERPSPYGACATFCLWELLARDDPGDRVLPALPMTVFPLRRALDSGPRDWPTTVRALTTLQKLAAVGPVGRALVPFYRQLLRPIGGYLQRFAEVITTDGLHPGVTYNMAELCHNTLCVLERTGGACAYVNIKNVIPTYQSCTAVGCTRKPGYQDPRIFTA